VARTLTGETVPLVASSVGAGKLGFVLRVPVGVVGAIAPFNFPLNLVAHKLGPAVAAGCAVVLKPASQTPFSSILLARIFADAGLPPGYLHVVTGGGGTVGNAIVDHPDIALITFTGSPDVGWGIRARAPRKRVGLELGNNAPVILEADGDWRAAVAKIRLAGFAHAGQSCISTQRVLVHESIADEVAAALAEAVSTLVVGDPMDEATEVPSLISVPTRPCRRLGAGGQGRRRVIATGGTIDDAGVLAPTVIADAAPT
jgi:acyl-CoA reductase-like NAD-dependent aldehyde dehydrogenase